MWCFHIQYSSLSYLYGNTTVASFCNDTTPPIGNGTVTTTPGTPSTPTSTGVETTSTSNTG